MGEVRNTGFWVTGLKGREHLGQVGVDDRILMDLQEVVFESVNYIQLKGSSGRLL
jgi:hypothetical protein